VNAANEVAHGGHDGYGSNVYDGLTEDHGDTHWAFGTGFDTEPAAELTAPVPAGVDPADLAEYCLMLGDDALIYSQRLAEWVTNAPELEEEVALANTALDLLGQARVLLARAAHVEGTANGGPVGGTAGGSPVGGSPVGTVGGAVGGGPARDEDRLAYWRGDAEFRNVALAELGNDGDFGKAIAQLLIFASWRLAVLDRLRDSTDPVLAAVAGKGVKELTYHRDYAARWTLRLGDGTDESHRRMQAALEWVWPRVDELFRTSDVERRLVPAGVAVDPAELREEVDAVLDEVLGRATLTRPRLPGAGTIGGRGGRQGVHTEALGHVLAEMQSLARQHPEATW
jgi:ring-1,2-phenylacetyl-CoA epoxidase subunit PaaC